MKKLLLICGLWVVSASAVAQVYKCTINGKTAYADSPCSPQAGIVNIMPGPAGPTADEIKTRTLLSEKKNEANAILKRRSLDGEIDRAMSNLDAVNYQKERNLAHLRAKKQQANNNLAGATWEQSISTEMQAVIASYEGKINRLQDALNDLRAERAQMDKKMP